MLWSKSTTVPSGHRQRWISARVTIAPLRADSRAKRRSGWVGTRTTAPRLRNSWSAATSSKAPNRTTAPGGSSGITPPR
jgi:hypothetical protein